MAAGRSIGLPGQTGTQNTQWLVDKKEQYNTQPPVAAPF